MCLRSIICFFSINTNSTGKYPLDALPWIKQFIETEINSDWLNSDQGKAEMAATPAGRPGVYDELSGPFMLLASDSGRFLNGVALPVDGGHAIA